jgi:chromosome segregation ATPase
MDAARAAALLDLHGADCYNAQAIERAWKRNLLKNHPDKNTSAQATERTQAANEAKEVLLKPLQAIDEKAEKKAYWAEMNRRYDEIRQRETAAMMEEHRKTEEARQLKKEAAAERKRKREAAAKIHENADNTRAELQALRLDYQEKALEIQGLRQERQELHTVKQEQAQEIQALRQERQELHSVKQEQAQEIQALRQERQELHSVKQEQAQEIKALKQEYHDRSQVISALMLECQEKAKAIQQLLSDCTIIDALAGTMNEAAVCASQAHDELLALQEKCKTQAMIIQELQAACSDKQCVDDAGDHIEQADEAHSERRQCSRIVRIKKAGMTLKKSIKSFVIDCIVPSNDEAPMLSIKTLMTAFRQYGYGTCTATQMGMLVRSHISAQHPFAERTHKSKSRGYIGIKLKDIQ